MKSEELSMFKYASMIKGVAFCATTFAFLSVVFKNSIVLVPEVTEIRLCNILACCYGIWFGPAGAWGCAIGNLVGDMAGSLTWLSIFGFTGNFLSAWIPYKIWGVTGNILGEKHMDRPSMQSKLWWLRYLICALVSVIACATVLAVPFDLSGSLSATNTFLLIFLNNMGAAVVGLILYIIMSQIPKNVLPYWREMMADDAEKVFSTKNKTKVIVMTAISILSAVFFFVYSGIKGISVVNMEAFGNTLTIAIAAITVLSLMIITALCRWEKDEGKAISLD